MSDQVRLLVAGQEYAGWKSVRIEAGIERQARSFDLEVTDAWPGQTQIPRRIRPFDTAQVFIGADLVLTGYVDATPIKYDGNSVTVAVRGRSKTADLVDCCPVEEGQAIGAAQASWGDVVGKNNVRGAIVRAPSKSANQWRNQKLEVIAAALAAPYGIRTIAEVDTGRPIIEHQVSPGESVFESIDRMMRIRHVLSTDNEYGDLVFIDVGSAGTASTMIELGRNVRAGSTDLDYKGVFSEYIVKGQRAGNDASYAEDVAEDEGTDTEDIVDTQQAITRDSRSKRKRVLVIRQLGQADDGTCKDRAEYERAHRAAKALQTTYTLQGWRQASGELWLPNLMVRVVDPLIGFDDEMVIAEVAWVLDKEGLRTEVRVGPPDGYRSKAGKLKRSQKGGGPSWSDIKDPAR